MIERYLEYLSAIRRYSPRTIEIYRGVLEDFASFSLSDLSGSKASARQNFASLIPPTAAQRVPPVYEATGGHGSAGLNLAAEATATKVSGGSSPWSEILSVQTVRAYEVWLM